MQANTLTPHIANASRRHDDRAVTSIRDVAPRAGRRRTVTIKATRVPRPLRAAIPIRVRP